MNYVAIINLFQQLDPETVALFTQFVMEAGQSGNPNDYVRTKLRIALRPEPPPEPKHVEVKVIEQDGKPVGERRAAKVRRS